MTEGRKWERETGNDPNIDPMKQERNGKSGSEKGCGAYKYSRSIKGSECTVEDAEKREGKLRVKDYTYTAAQHAIRVASRCESGVHVWV